MSQWKEEHILVTYELARTGASETQIASTLGVSRQTFIAWKKKHPALRTALRRGCVWKRGQGDQDRGFSFRDYVYDQLEEETKRVWDQLDALERAGSAKEKIEALLSHRGQSIRQHLFIYAWTSSNWSLSRALKKVNISYATFRFWRDNDPGFAMLVEEIDFHKRNFFEEHLCKLVANGDSPATIFANRSYNKDRGYGEHTTIDLNAKVEHRVMSIDSLNLPIDMRREILERMRKRVESKDVTGQNGGLPDVIEQE